MVEFTDMDISSFRKFSADEKPDNHDEFNIATKSLTQATINERRASLKLKNGHDCEEDSNSFSLFTSVKHDLPTNKDVPCGDIVTETGTCISLYSLERARPVLKDGLIDEGKIPEDKLPVVSGCSCLVEESPIVEISVAEKIHFHNLGLEIIADHLKVIAMKDKEKNPERQGTSLSDGLAHIEEDDKGLLEETIILHSSKVEEKHLSSFFGDQNAEEREIGSISEKSIGEGLFSNKVGSAMRILAEGAERDRKSGILSDQKENIFEVPARDCARNSGLDLNISNSTNCLDAILQSSCTRMDDSVDSLIETTMPVSFSRDNYTSVESLDCGVGCDKFVASNVNCEHERFEVHSQENYAVESSSLKGQDSKEKTEFPDGWMSETINNSALLCTVNNFPLQVSPSLASEKAKIEVVAESNFASKKLSDASIISCLSSSIGFPADDLVHGHLETCGLKPEKMEVIPGNILGNTRIHQEVSEGQITVVEEQKANVNDQKLVSLSQCTKDSIETCELTENLSGNVLDNSGICREDSEGKIPVVDEQKATVNNQKLLALSHITKDSSGTYELTENLSGNVLGSPGIHQDDSEGQLAVIDEQKATFNGQKLLVLSHCTKSRNEIHELTENLSGNVLGNPGIHQDDSEGQIAVGHEQKATVNGQKLLVLCTKASTETHELTENLSGNVLGNSGIRQEDLEGQIAVVDEQKATVNGQKLLAVSHCTKDGTETCVLTENLSGNILGNRGIPQQYSEGQIAVVDEHKATVNGQKLLVISHCTKAGTETRELTENLSGNFSGNPGICHEDSEGQIAVPDEQKATGHGHKRLLLSNCTEDSTETCELTDNRLVDSKATKCDTAEKSGGNTAACVLLNVDIKSVSKNCCEDARSQLPKVDFCMPKPELKVVSHYPKDLLPTAHGMVINASGKRAQRILQISPEHVPRFILYESPLDMFKSHRIYSDLITANGVPDKLITCSHVINPFWPLCNFEHRGKCNNEDCPWQHAKDYNLTPSQVLEQLNKYSNDDMDGSFGCQELRSCGNKDLQIYSEAATKEAIGSSKFLCKVPRKQSAMSRSLLHHSTGNYGLKVPVYRIGPHLLKADGPMVGSLIACSTWRFWKLGFCQSFSIPLAVQRLLPSDMPCLHSAAVREWMLGNNSRLPTCLYTSSVIGKPDDTQKHLFRGLGDIECWLELAIDSMNIDSNIDKSDGRKKALYVLSRAIEINPNSVAVWMAYLHIFYRKEKVIGTDDMFHHAVQHNKGSYELWLLFINSRLQMDQRLGAYNSAITALCQNVGGDENHVKLSSPFVLDIVLQMFNFLSMSGNKHKAMTWIDELLYCSSENYGKGQSDFISISTVLPYLRKKDACVLMVCCTYFRVYGKLPKAILGRLEFEQELPFDVDWQNCQLSEASRDSAMKLMDFAVSSLSECCVHDSLELWKNDKDALLSVYALVVNHIKFVSEFEGLISARDLCCYYRKLYPTCVELVPVYSCIESHCRGDTASISVFQESLFNWPDNKPGIQRLWNLFVHYALDSKGVDFAKDLSNQWFFYMDQKKLLDSIISLKGAGYHMFYPSEHAEDKQEVDESKDMRKGAHHFLARTDTDQKCWSQELMFGLLNLAMHRLLNNDAKEAQTAADQALKVASDDRDVKHCIREYAALAVLGSPEGIETIKNGFDTRMLQVLDKCFQESQLFPVAKPLSRAFSEKIKKPKIRLFIDNLLGPIPLDSSLLNSVIETWYGPSLLPKKFGALKDLVDFVEGLLELAPANLNLVLSISRLIGQMYNSQSMSSMAAVLWAISLLINSIFQSFPIAPEDIWIEVGNFLELLDIDIILEEFYQKALSVHPFSVTLWHSFFNFRQHTDNLGGVVEAAKQRGIVLD